MTRRPQLPPPADPDRPYRVAVVCLGNICRSPIAEVVLTARLAEAGLDGAVEVASSGTGDWHVGEPMDRRAAALLTAHGYDASRHRAQQFEASWFAATDLVLAMDAANHADLAELARSAGVPSSDAGGTAGGTAGGATGASTGPDVGRVRLFRDFDPRAGDGDRDVPDPYFGGDEGFAEVLAMVDRTVAALVGALQELLDPAPEAGG